MRIVLFLIFSLISAVVAAGASMTECRIWGPLVYGGPNVDLAVDSGATSCMATAAYGAEVSAEFDVTGGYFLRASVHASAKSSNPEFDLPAGEAMVTGDVSEVVTFYGVPAGSTLILEWLYMVDRIDAYQEIEFLGVPIGAGSSSLNGTSLLPIIDNSVSLSASLNANTGGPSFGRYWISLGRNYLTSTSTRIVDAGGNPVTGFTYSTASDRQFLVQDGVGVQVSSIPEPATGLLLVLPLIWLARRRR